MEDKAVFTKPAFTKEDAGELTQRFYGVNASKISSMPSYIDQNFLVVDAEGSKFVLKIMNFEDSKKAALLEVQTQCMSFLRQQGVPTHKAIANTEGELLSFEEKDFGQGAHTYCVRLLTYIHGKTILDSPVTNKDLFRVGQLIGNVNKTLQEMVTPNQDDLREEDVLWHLTNIPAMEKNLSVLDGEPLQEVVKEVIGLYKTHVEPNLCMFQQGIIHGDMRGQNILVTSVDGQRHEISGVLDFSLLLHGYYVFEVAISIACLMMGSPNPMDVGGAVLAGYESILPLSDAERSSIYLLVLGRLCQSLVYGKINLQKYPNNEKYLLSCVKGGTQILDLLRSVGKQEMEKKWFSDVNKYTAVSV